MTYLPSFMTCFVDLVKTSCLVLPETCQDKGRQVIVALYSTSIFIYVFTAVQSSTLYYNNDSLIHIPFCKIQMNVQSSVPSRGGSLHVLKLPGKSRAVINFQPLCLEQANQALQFPRTLVKEDHEEVLIYGKKKKFVHEVPPSTQSKRHCWNLQLNSTFEARSQRGTDLSNKEQSCRSTVKVTGNTIYGKL